MSHYWVTWEWDVEASSPEEAARLALAVLRDPDAGATLFKVWLAVRPETPPDGSVTVDAGED